MRTAFDVEEILDQYVALERSTTKTNPIDIESFLGEYPQYRSIYESWQKLEDHMQVKKDKNHPFSSRKISCLIKNKDASEENSEVETSTAENIDETDLREDRRKRKRHVGPHDNGGLQRTISTGIEQI